MSKNLKIPTVSIGMPVYNGGLYLREALDSLLKQTFSDFELIISDNYSSDDTGEICLNYCKSDERIKYIRQNINKGATWNFNFVLNEAVGKYFMWAAADDVWDINWIEELLKNLVNKKTLVFGRIITIDSKSELLFNPSSGNSFSFTGSAFIRRLKYYVSLPALGKANPIYGLFDRGELINFKISILDEVKFGADMLLVFNFLSKLEIVKPFKMVNLYKRIHDQSQGNNVVLNSKEENLFYFVFRNGKNILNYGLEPFQRFLFYFKYLKFIEIVLYLFLTPLLSLINLIFFNFYIFPVKVKSYLKF